VTFKRQQQEKPQRNSKDRFTHFTWETFKKHPKNTQKKQANATQFLPENFREEGVNYQTV